LITATGAALIGAAGVLAGIVGTAGGITSLVSYPALLAAGVPALPANMANIVALVACWPGSALASRPELVGRAHWLRRWSLVTVAGGVAGAALLLSTPSQDFSVVVPYLVAAGSLALILQPAIPALGEHHAARQKAVLLAGLLWVSLYSGYFGAGSGIMTLALLMITVEPHLATANALKNMLVGVATVVAAITVVAFGHVEWAAVAPLAVGLFAGSLIGPRLARRLPAAVLRWFAALLGIGLAIRLWLAPA